MAFEIAARAAFREASRDAGAKLLEPIMLVEVVTPEEYMGDIIGDLNSRRGQVRGMEARGNASRDQCDGAAGKYVRLCEYAAFNDARSRAIFHAV